MTMNRLTASSVTSGDLDEHRLAASVDSQAMAIKANKNNTDWILIAGSKEELEAGEGWPLEPGEKVAFDLKGTEVWFQAESENDILHVLTLQP